MLLAEVIHCLAPRPGESAVDCTLGYGGHARELAKRLAPGGVLLGLDVDAGELARSAEALRSTNTGGTQIRTRRANFSEVSQVIVEEGLNQVDILLADLGVSSMQVDDPARGIGYKADGPLDMRMDDRLGRTGAEVINSLPLEDLSAALKQLADEPDHQRIAEWIVNQRQAAPIEHVSQLVRLVLHAKGIFPKGSKPGRKMQWNEYGTQHPAARTFQAIRMLVNDELGHLAKLLAAAPDVLKPGGRIAVISFHSGEDRLVKQAFRNGLDSGVYAETAPKPITPTAGEVRRNPRSASAKLRWARRSAATS